MPDEDLMQAEWEKHGNIIQFYLFLSVKRNSLFQVHVIMQQQQIILQE